MISVCGPVFWVLIVLLIVSVFVYMGRLIDLRRTQIDYQDFLKGVINVLDRGNDAEALVICEDTAAPVAQIVATAIRHRHVPARVLREAVDSQGRAEVGRLDRRLASLAIIAQIAPLLGLLGTLIGFIRVVLIVNGRETLVRADLLTGTMQALVVAAVGIAIAIIVSVMYGSLRVRLDRTVVDLEAAASQIIGYISSQKEKEKIK